MILKNTSNSIRFILLELNITRYEKHRERVEIETHRSEMKNDGFRFELF